MDEAVYYYAVIDQITELRLALDASVTHAKPSKLTYVSENSMLVRLPRRVLK